MTYEETELSKKRFKRFVREIYKHGIDAIEMGFVVENPLYLVQEICQYLNQIATDDDDIRDRSIH